MTIQQARDLLPLWQALQGGVTAEPKVNAVLKSTEEAMTEEQLSLITDMELAEEDVQAWAEELGVRFDREGESPGTKATRRPAASDDEIPPDTGTRRAQFEKMSEEEQETMKATVQAGGNAGNGFQRGEGGTAPSTVGGLVQTRLLLSPLIDLLSEGTGGAEA